MKKKVIFLSLLLVIAAACFIPFTLQKTITVKVSFFNTYQQLAKADNWKKWRTDLRKASLSDSSKISHKQGINGFNLGYANLDLHVSIVNGSSFRIHETNSNKEFDYSYTVLPEKAQNVTSVIVTEKTNIIKYLFSKLSGKLFSETHINDFKHYMEDADLYYGYKIVKQKVTDTNIIVLRKVVLAKNKFNEAGKSLNMLKQYIDSKGLKQTQPFIAQFFQKADDSLQLNIGLPINKKTITNSPMVFMEMPKTGNIYTVKFHGKFMERIKAYAAVYRYFSDRNMPVPILPFETYLDNKLPESDSDIVNIQINFSTF